MAIFKAQFLPFGLPPCLASSVHLIEVEKESENMAQILNNTVWLGK